ncbi:MAG: gliding motility-associated C-terminal domain-containing protein, partial [Bacteroidota bacterium]
PLPGIEFYLGPTATTEYEILVIDVNGCIATDAITIVVERNVKVFVPNIFSPNGDGANDIFTIETDETVIEILEMQVFDRWGEQMFVASNFVPNDRTTGWEGTFRNEPAPAGVYVYYFRLLLDNGVEELISGDITLIR